MNGFEFNVSSNLRRGSTVCTGISEIRNLTASIAEGDVTKCMKNVTILGLCSLAGEVNQKVNILTQNRSFMTAQSLLVTHQAYH